MTCLLVSGTGLNKTVGCNACSHLQNLLVETWKAQLFTTSLSKDTRTALTSCSQLWTIVQQLTDCGIKNQRWNNGSTLRQQREGGKRSRTPTPLKKQRDTESNGKCSLPAVSILILLRHTGEGKSGEDGRARERHRKIASHDF